MSSSMCIKSEINMDVTSTNAEEKIGDQQDVLVSHESVNNVLRASPTSRRVRRSSSTSRNESTHEIFRPRSFFEHDIFSERRILLSSPIYVIDSSDEEIERGEEEERSSSGTKFVRNLWENDENDVSRLDVLNSMVEDVTKSNATCALLEEYRIMVPPTSMDKRNLEDGNLKIYCTVNALKESSFWVGERKVSPRTIIN